MILKIVLWILALCAGLYALLWIRAIWASIARNRKLEQWIQPAIDALEKGLPETGDRIAELASRPATRSLLYRRLLELGKSDRFPEQYCTQEKLAESDLALWLMHPNELGEAPEDMGLIRSIPVEGQGKHGTIHLFRFRASAAHWAACRGWMAGIAGPYWEDEEASTIGSETFSELTPFETMTVEEHVADLRARVSQKGLIVRA